MTKFYDICPHKFTYFIWPGYLKKPKKSNASDSKCAGQLIRNESKEKQIKIVRKKERFHE